MSVNTQADKLAGQASRLSRELARVLTELVLEEPHGIESYSDEAREDLAQAQQEAMALHRRLRSPYESLCDDEEQW